MLEAQSRSTAHGLAPGVMVNAPLAPGYADVLTAEALTFIASLERRFRPERKRLLAKRQERQERFDRGELPGFLAQTEQIRMGNWQVAPAPGDLTDRRVEITGPVDRKMMINALNSGANVFMADVEDSLAPTWDNVVQGQINLIDAIRGVISYADPASGKTYSLNEKTATLVVRPRGWHLDEAHVEIDQEPVSGSLFDFALYLFHNHEALTAKGSGPYYYLAKLESHLEAKLWADVFIAAEETLGLAYGTIRATVLIETLPAAFEMEEILYVLRDHICGLNCGRWDYIFSFIKKFRNRPDFVFPDRSQVTMVVPCMRAYSQLLIKTCHRRGAHAMGGMSAYIPVKTDTSANETAMAAVIADKMREATDGHDGTWVAHPGLIEIAKKIFDEVMPSANQLGKYRDDVRVSAADLLALPEGTITEAGLRNNLRVGIQYIEAWLGGLGCVPLYNLMEDAATAEICRVQVWQWLKHEAALTDGRKVTSKLVGELLDAEMVTIHQTVGAERFRDGHFEAARQLFFDVASPPGFDDFLTLKAYEMLTPAVQHSKTEASLPR